MKIEKLPSGSFRVRKMYKGKTYSLTFDAKPTKSQIDEELRKRLSETEHATRELTFKQAAEMYCESKKNVLSPRTHAEYKRMIRNFPEWFCSMRIDDIKQIDINNLVNEFAIKNAPKTVSNKHGFVSGVLKTFRSDFDLNTTLPLKVKSERLPPTEEELKIVLDELRGTMFYIPVALACYGMRRSEIYALEPSDLDGTTVHITKAKVKNDDKEFVVKYTKTTESYRDIYISQELADMIQEQGYVYNGGESSINRAMHRIQKKRGLSDFCLHGLRHFFASKMANITAGVNIQALGGWKTDYVMKRTYTHAQAVEVEKAKKGAVDIFNNSIFDK